MRARLILTAMVLVIAACTDRILSTSMAPASAISDGATGGNPHFFFLPPMVARPDSSGANERGLHPVVVVCQYTDGCVTTLAKYTTDQATTTTSHPGNSETVRSSAAHYIVNWHTRAFDLDPDLGYRVCVQVGDLELGFTDVDVVPSGADLNDVPPELVAVKNGQTLPIKFRIADGALDETGTSGCGSQPT